jgi:uncharacterized metal-binding protein
VFYNLPLPTIQKEQLHSQTDSQYRLFVFFSQMSRSRGSQIIHRCRGMANTGKNDCHLAFSAAADHRNNIVSTKPVECIRNGCQIAGFIFDDTYHCCFE